MLPAQAGDLNSDPQYPYDMPGLVVSTCKPSADTDHPVPPKKSCDVQGETLSNSEAKTMKEDTDI